MPEQKSKYTELLESLGFIRDDEPSETRDAFLDLRQRPTTPVFSIIMDEKTGKPAVTIVVDEVGDLWAAPEKEVDLTEQGFGDYFSFRSSLFN